MSFPRYPKYKPSGVEWLGEVPEHWGVMQSRRMFRVRNERARESDRQVTASQKYGILYQTDFVELEGRRVVETIMGTEILRRIERNDFVISLRSFQGGIEWCQIEGSVTFHYVVLTPVKDVFEPFFAHLFKSIAYIQALRSTTNLIRDGQDLRFSHFVQVDLPVIPIVEQRAIASFLNRETAKIDSLVGEQRRLIELLKEKRQAVISHAVTKGLNRHAPLKPSGIEWLGDVPEHWEVSPLKRIVAIPITDGPHETPQFFDEGVPFVSAEAVSSGRIDFSRVRACISEEDNARYSLKYSPKLHDIYMVKSGATTGVTAIVEDRTDFNIWSPLAVIRCGEEVVPHFVLNFMRSRNFLEAVSLNWSFGTQQNIGMGVIENLACTVPPVEEQSEIAQFLKHETAKLDALTAEAERGIELLQERRTALISAAVTGKIDVRGLAETEAA